MEKASKMESVINLSIGEPDFDTPPSVKDAAKRAIDEGFTHYTTAHGISELRTLISEKYNEKYDPEEEVIVTAGAQEALFISLFSLIERGDEILIPDPGYIPYEQMIAMCGGIPVGYPLSESNRFVPEPDIIKELISKETKAILLNSPHNPTGAVVDRRKLKELIDILFSENIIIISDEVYDSIVFDNNFASLSEFDDVRDRLLLISSFSKTYAMTGWRIGYLCGDNNIVSQLKKAHLYTVSNPASISQKAAIAAILEAEKYVENMIKEYRKRRDILINGLNKLGISCIEPSGTFYAFPNISKYGTSEEFSYGLLEKHGVVTVPGSYFGSNGEGFIRISFATEMKNIKKALDCIEEYIQVDERELKG